jgi:RNA polymerase sigma factor (sigma-70 family)
MNAKPPLPPFQSVLDEHRGAVMAFLVAMVGPADADDCFQETFLAALRAYPRLSDARNLRGWVLTIAHRKAIDSLRATAHRPAPRAKLPDRGYADAGLAEAENGLGEAWRAVVALPPRQRAAVAHRFVADLRYREIGAILGCSEAAARRSVHDGLARIREEMGT